MLRINAHKSSLSPSFTLVELMVGLSLATIVFAGILAAYLFLGRNLARMANMQEQMVKNRRALQLFTKDLSSAVALTNSSSTTLSLTVPTVRTLTNCAITSGGATVTCASTAGLVTGMSLSGVGFPSAATVSSIINGTTFVMSANATSSNTGLTVDAVGQPSSVTYTYTAGADGTGSLNRADSSGETILLGKLSAFTFNFYGVNGASVSASSPQSIKFVEFSYTTATEGAASSGTRANFSTLSPRVILRNKPALL
jgi:hypothetical protein